MIVALHLLAWDRAKWMYRLDPGTRRLERVEARLSEGEPPAGFVKRCIFGPPLAVFELDGGWFIRAGRQEMSLAEPSLALRIRRWGPLTRVTLETAKERRHCLYSETFGWVAARVDPTFDDLDASAADFSRFLLEKYRQAQAGHRAHGDRGN